MANSLSEVVMAAVLAVGEGNPGALNVALRLAQSDPCALGECLYRGFVGARLWVLYKDICGENLDEMTHRLREGHALYLQDCVDGVMHGGM